MYFLLYSMKNLLFYLLAKYVLPSIKYVFSSISNKRMAKYVLPSIFLLFGINCQEQHKSWCSGWKNLTHPCTIKSRPLPISKHFIPTFLERCYTLILYMQSFGFYSIYFLLRGFFNFDLALNFWPPEKFKFTLFIFHWKIIKKKNKDWH